MNPRFEIRNLKSVIAFLPGATGENFQSLEKSRRQISSHWKFPPNGASHHSITPSRYFSLEVSWPA
jgi:hypothetical protein